MVRLLFQLATPFPFGRGVPIGDSRQMTRVAAYDAKPYAFSDHPEKPSKLFGEAVEAALKNSLATQGEG